MDPWLPSQCTPLNDTPVATTNADTMVDVWYHDGYDDLVILPSSIDVDAIEDSLITLLHKKQQCYGIQVDFPPGSSAHSSYPFGIHDELGGPWDYSFTKGVMILCRKGCTVNTANPTLASAIAVNCSIKMAICRGSFSKSKLAFMKTHTLDIIALGDMWRWSGGRLEKLRRCNWKDWTMHGSLQERW